MRSLKSYLLIAALSLIAISVQGTAIIRSKSNICNNLTIQCTSCTPPTTTTQAATADKNGHIVIQVSKAGTYKVSAADGPKKGQVLETVTATKAGKISLSVALAAAE
jgi:hypothetical protein